MTQLDSMPPEPEHVSGPHYTPTEKRLLKALSDGDKHLASSLMPLLNDELTERKTLSAHIGNIRRKLPKGEYIVTEIKFLKIYYRHVILLSSGTDTDTYSHNSTSSPNPVNPSPQKGSTP